MSIGGTGGIGFVGRGALRLPAAGERRAQGAEEGFARVALGRERLMGEIGVVMGQGKTRVGRSLGASR
jgi:hypothetical protein